MGDNVTLTDFPYNFRNSIKQDLPTVRKNATNNVNSTEIIMLNLHNKNQNKLDNFITSRLSITNAVHTHSSTSSVLHALAEPFNPYTSPNIFTQALSLNLDSAFSSFSDCKVNNSLNFSPTIEIPNEVNYDISKLGSLNSYDNKGEHFPIHLPQVSCFIYFCYILSICVYAS